MRTISFKLYGDRFYPEWQTSMEYRYNEFHTIVTVTTDEDGIPSMVITTSNAWMMFRIGAWYQRLFDKHGEPSDKNINK